MPKGWIQVYMLLFPKPKSTSNITFSGDFISPTSSMTKAALSGVWMLNFWHTLLVLGTLDVVIVALMLSGEVSAVEVVPGSWQQHSFSRIATGCLSPQIIGLEAVACPLLGGGADG
jgi:hypothetical protein